MADWKAQTGSSALVTGQAELLPLRLDAIVDDAINGQHLHLVGECGGDRYYCKRDSNGTAIRATEWFCSSLASTLDIPVPDFTPIINPANDEILFGSRGQWGTASEFDAKTFLTTPQVVDRAISADPPWLCSYLSRLYVFDLFIANPDRQFRNFLLVRNGGYRTLLAYDFASANLNYLTNSRLLIADTQTVSVGRMLRGLHGFDAAAAVEMLDSIDALPARKIESIVSAMPEDWYSEIDKGKAIDGWSKGAIGDRLAALRRGLNDGSIL